MWPCSSWIVYEVFQIISWISQLCLYRCYLAYCPKPQSYSTSICSLSEVLTNQLICECHALLAESTSLWRWVEDFDQSSVAWVHIGQRDLQHFLSDVAWCGMMWRMPEGMAYIMIIMQDVFDVFDSKPSWSSSAAECDKHWETVK